MQQQIDAMKQMRCAMPSPDVRMACHKMMEARMEMMTGMLEQMLLHEEAQESAAPKR